MLSTTVAVLLVIVAIEAFLVAIGVIADILGEVLPEGKFTYFMDGVGDLARETFFWVALPLVIVLLMTVINSVVFLVPILL